MLVCKFCIYLEEEELTDNDTSRTYATKTYRGKGHRRYMLCMTSSSRGFRYPDVYRTRALDVASDDSNYVRLVSSCLSALRCPHSLTLSESYLTPLIDTLKYLSLILRDFLEKGRIILMERQVSVR
jgi:hypothetical protein